jgi:hypothetical protein
LNGLDAMTAIEKSLDELTVLVREKLTELGASSVRFTIRPLPYEAPNWQIDTAPPLRRLRQDEQAALTAVSFELRSRYDLRVDAAPSPHAAGARPRSLAQR